MKLVVAIDGPECAKTAIEYILKGKYGPGTEIDLVHVLVPGFADAAVVGIPDRLGEEKLEEQALLAETAAALTEKLGAKVSTEILAGETAEVIAEVCKRFAADEVIVPSHARHGFSRLWFGSVADRIADEAPCTTIVLKMPQASA